MLDTLIPGESIAGGTGDTRRSADIGILEGKILEIGQISANAARTIGADGAIVTPGFVDIQTHYDGQLLSDEKVDTIFSHGITTVVISNCGIELAPVGLPESTAD